MVFILFVILVIFAGYTLSMFRANSSSDLDEISRDEKEAIAVVEVKGVILDSKAIIENLHRAEKAKGIKAILLRIDSPGGTVGPTQEIYQEIRRIDKTRPVYASFGAIAASGGYYVGAAARKIFSNPGTLTGSIGVLLQFLDLSRLYEWMKISPETIKAGHYKDTGNPGRSLTPKERKMLKETLQSVHKQFIDDILRLRKKKIKGDMSFLAQGQIFSGEQAYKYGLVDELGGLWEAGRKIHKELKLKGEFHLHFIKKKKKFQVFELLKNLDEAISELNLKFKGHPAPVPMYLYKR